jgi:hypothetical protein
MAVLPNTRLAGDDEVARPVKVGQPTVDLGKGPFAPSEIAGTVSDVGGEIKD